MVSKIEDCPSFRQCEAPLCPVYEHLSEVVWYSDEPVCRSRQFKHHWLRVQKRIARRVHDVDAGYFTVKMLESITAVSSKTKGIDPDRRASEKVWVGKRVKKSEAMP